MTPGKKRRYKALAIAFATGLIFGILAYTWIYFAWDRDMKQETTQIFLFNIPQEVITTIKAIVAGIFIGLPFGYYFSGNKIHWAITGFLNIVIVISYIWLGGSGLIIAIMAATVTFILAASLVIELYKGNLLDAITHQFRLATGGMLKGFVVVDGGRITIPKDTGVILGPKLVIVKPGNSVVLEQGAARTEIYGPRIFESGEFEYIKKIYDLTQQKTTININNAVTRDIVSVNAKLMVNYCINIERRKAYGDIPLDSWDIEHLQELDRTFPNWEDFVLATVEESTRDIIRQTDIKTVINKDGYSVLAQRILTTVSARTLPWRILIQEIVMQDLQIDEAIVHAQTEALAERVSAEAYRDALETIANGYRTAEDLGMSEESLHAEALRHLLNVMSNNPKFSVLFNRELNELFSYLRNN